MRHWKISPVLLIAAGLALPSGSVASAAEPAGNGALVQLIEQFAASQQRFDAAAMAALMTDDYVEVSPIGEVDRRAEVLGFYAPEKKTPIPPTRVLEPVVRTYGDTASIIAKLSYSIPGANGVAQERAIRASYLARRSASGWKLAAAQYTPIRVTAPTSGK